MSPQCLQTLALLKQGRQTSYALAQVSLRYGARLLELRRDGYEIATEHHVHPHTGKRYAVYTLVKEEGK